jgi:hypothetical protein
MSTRIVDPDIPEDKIVQIVRTGQPSAEGVTRMRAIMALRHSRSTRKAEVFSSLLANRQEPPRFRHMAVTGLLELGGVGAERALLESVRNADELTAAPLALALGRIGSPDAETAISGLRSRALPAQRSQVEFAMSLLAYRHNLAGGEVAVPAADSLLSIKRDSRTQPIVIAPADPAEIESAARALKREPAGIEVVFENAQQIRCEPNSFLLLWNSAFTGPRLAALRERKGIAAVVLRKNPIENEYSVSSLVLVTPNSHDLQVSVHKPRGVAAYAGRLTVQTDGSATFALRTVRKPGAIAIEFSGSVVAGKLTVEAARSSLTVLDRRTPQPEPRG